MPVSVEFFPMVGGLDVVTPHYQISPGKLIECLNYECLPEGGYRRIDGYSLYDGTTEPEAVPGEGDIRGVWVFSGNVYAIRDQESNGGLFRATGTGWVEVDLGYSLDFDAGVNDFVEGATVTGGTSAETATIERVIFAGGTNGVGDSFGRLVISGATGPFTDNEDLIVGGNTIASAKGTQFANTLPTGGKYTFVTGNFFGHDGLDRMYGANGVGEAFEFDGTVFAPILTDSGGAYPRHIAVHKGHLMLGFSTGSITTSAPGEPLIFDAILGASEIAVGDQINLLASLPGGVLCVGCDDSIQMLYGNDYLSWELQPFTQHGAKPYSFGEIGGNYLVLDNRGLQNIRATQAFGDFEAISQSRAINPLLISSRTSLYPSAALVSKEKSQYRLFFGTEGYYFSYAGESFAGVTPVLYSDPVIVAAAGEDDLGKEIMFFGSEDGKVFRFDSAYKFNGEDIFASMRLAFNFEKTPTQRKQYRKAVLDIKGERDSALILVRSNFDFNSPIDPASDLYNVNGPQSSGGQWSFDDWDEFLWDAVGYTTVDIGIAGIGRNMSMSFTSLGEEDGSHTIYGAAIHYSLRRLDR
tara:strand:- start:3152 stop:4894 length:1743 start_codon:yes stop_codon:yes gene_type:complete